MTSDVNSVDMHVAYSGNDQVMVGNGQSLSITDTGFVKSLLPNCPLILPNVLVVPGTKKNLLSISQLTKDNN